LATFNNNFKVKNGLDASGDISTTGAVTAAGNLRSTNSSGDEGGEIFLNKAATNTTLTNGVTIDVWQNRLRFFEQGGNARGFFIDISTGGNGVSTNLVGGGYTLPTATATTLGGIELFSATTQTTAANAVTTTASRTYGLQLNSDLQGVVNVPWTDTVYTLPTATATALGGIELFSATTQTTAANAVTTTASRTYGLQLNADLQGVVNVPWTDTNTFPTTWTWTAGTTAGPTASITGTSSTITVAAVPVANDTTASGVVTTGTQTFGGAKTFSSAVTAAGLTTTAAVNLNYASPTIASNNASAASIFTGTVTGVTIGSSTIRTTAFPADGTTSTATAGAGYMGLPQNATTTGAYTIVAADAGRHIYASATRTVTINSNANLALPIGTTITFIAGTGATMTIAITTDTLILAGPGTTGSRTLAPFGMATAVKITSTSWIISGNGLT
jgi:hypothetical protein